MLSVAKSYEKNKLTTLNQAVIYFYTFEKKKLCDGFIIEICQRGVLFVSLRFALTKYIYKRLIIDQKIKPQLPRESYTFLILTLILRKLIKLPAVYV